MKKIILTATALSIAATLTACGGSFRKVQTPAEMQQPMNCTGLHMKNATWMFTDDFGQQVTVTGTCKKGQKHGNFTFKVGEKTVAVTKFVKDIENKTACTATNEKTRTPLEECMKQFNELNSNNAAAAE